MALSKRRSRWTIGNTVLLLWLWLCSGFSIGTWILRGGPVEAVRGNPNEKMFVIAYIVALVIVTFLLSLWLTKLSKKSAGFVKWIFIVILTVAMAYCLNMWLNPKDSGVTTSEKAGEAEFIFGTYPKEEKLDSLAKEGYTAVISLLHEAVVPFEPVLLKEELENAKKAGIEVIHIPMMPWVMNNDSALKKIAEIAAKGHGKYYVHCYLGKDRVNVVKNKIKSENAKFKMEYGETHRHIKIMDSLERGHVYTLIPDSVYLTPYPTPEEMNSYFLNGTINSVLSLQNPLSPDGLKWISEEMGVYKTYKINFYNLPVDDKTSIADIKKVIASIDTMQKPLIVHAFLTDKGISQTFLKVYQQVHPEFIMPVNANQVK